MIHIVIGNLKNIGVVDLISQYFKNENINKAIHIQLFQQYSQLVQELLTIIIVQYALETTLHSMLCCAVLTKEKKKKRGHSEQCLVKY